MNPQAQPSQMLPPQAVASMIRSGGTPGQIFQQNPLSQNQLPGAAGFDPTLAQQPQVPTPQVSGGPMMPPGGQQMPQQQPAQGASPMPGGQQPLTGAELIEKVLADRLAHHSKITEKTVGAILNQVNANTQVSPPTA